MPPHLALISDKSAEIPGSEYWKNCQFSIQNRPFSPSCSYANKPSDITSPEIVTFGQDFHAIFYLPAVPGLCFASNLFPLITQ